MFGDTQILLSSSRDRTCVLSRQPLSPQQQTCCILTSPHWVFVMSKLRSFVRSPIFTRTGPKFGIPSRKKPKTKTHSVQVNPQEHIVEAPLLNLDNTQSSMPQSPESKDSEIQVDMTDEDNHEPDPSSKPRTSEEDEERHCRGPLPEPDEDMARVMGVLFSGHARVDQLMRKVGNCDGSDPEKTLKWLRAVDATECPLDLAKATAEGPLAAHIRQCTGKWAGIKQDIAVTFISAAFEQHQRDALRNFTQRPGESITTYNYEFKALVEEGYPTLPTDQGELVRVYLSNLANRGLAEALVQNDQITTLENAMNQALKKSKVSEMLIPRPKGRTGSLSSPLTPELAAVTKALDAVTALATDLTNSHKKLQGEVASMKTPSPKPVPQAPVPMAPPAQRRRATRDDRCYRCGRYGHFAADCRQSLPAKPNPGTQSQNMIKCGRCRRTDHQTRNCRAGPPSRPCYCGGHHWVYDCPENRQGATQAPARQNQGN